MKKGIVLLASIALALGVLFNFGTSASANPNKGDPSPESFPVAQYTLKQDIQ